jgi:hypothetical protein
LDVTHVNGATNTGGRCSGLFAEGVGKTGAEQGAGQGDV